ncbi:galactose-1-epimerase [Pseudodesulfovibrio cashew]|uniref:Aldose 1-epimerase n=1 Tax=Pseudodesulfovibrio cashew TaxID=2678688 RepID=A0A6I6JFS3_9BACT|nr:aldose epimerase family protein [Pseudodesulfovibrio cashew]QGY39262.1 galactose-1-epimerase [Pseudodesulfovibrio cashew]
MDIRRQTWGALPDGREVSLFTLTNGRGMRASIADYGATLVELTAPDRRGAMADVILGYDTLEEYRTDPNYFGVTVGRVSNRVSNSRFELDGTVHKVTPNEGENQVHGGPGGFHSRLWDASVGSGPDSASLVLRYHSPDGEEGYPGDLDAEVTYTLADRGLVMEFKAVTDKPTLVSLTNHAYFNLSGNLEESVLDHVLTLNASRYLPTDDALIPTGEIADVAGSPMDFTRPKAVGLDVDAPHEAIAMGQGYDHYFVLDGAPGEMKTAAQLFHGGSGRVLEVRTTQPGVQFYSGNGLPERLSGKLGALYGHRHGLCLEAHGYVDAPNQPGFPAITLRPGETYQHVTEYRFSTT